MGLMDCWHMVLSGVWEVAKVVWPIPAAYAALYAVTATVFLITLKVRSVDGVLRVSKQSFAFLLAHPLARYTLSAFKEEQGSICSFYARLFNMLLFVWPIIGAYFLLLLLPGNVLMVLLAGHYLIIDMSTDGFVQLTPISIGGTRIYGLLWYSLPVLVLILAVWKWAKLIHIVKVLALGVACGVPIWVPLVIAIYVVIKLTYSTKVDSPKTYAVKEYVLSTKEGFCKLVKFD